MEAETIPVRRPGIRLDAFLKFAGATATGGEAKMLIQGGRVRVNGERETRRGRSLVDGDMVELFGGGEAIERTWMVAWVD
ncbi:MAG: RNA-binding S4 domain-containing protein [Candidatus Eisenbacteria bacterium]|nr:RNA-binding S4 domain-containing protein [Candidatus Eisenbacteria bacterium]